MQRQAVSGELPRHRACDECRARKLACSKDAAGCERCRKEGIQCVYSAQKPMGRPRKRRAAASEDASEDALNDACIDATCPPVNGVHEIPQQLPQELPVHLHPQGHSCDADLSFLHLLPSETAAFGHAADHDPWHSLSDPSYPPHIFGHGGHLGLDDPPSGLDFSGNHVLEGINFDEADLASSSIAKDINISLQQYVTGRLAPPPPPSAPQHDPPSVVSVDTSSSHDESPEPARASPPGRHPKPLPSAFCGCLSSLYLSLESLNRLPSEVPAAMRVARSAIKVAQDVLECPHCTTGFLEDPLKPPPVQALQNMMCFGALIPSTCNAYATILELIDDESEAARRAGNLIYFSFRDVGGLWGLVVDGQDSCGALRAYDNKNLDPDVWQATVRSILKLDVYGLGGETGLSSSTRHLQMGLKDLIDRLDHVAKSRHALLDDLVAAGKMPKHSRYMMHPHKPLPVEQRNCVRVVESARMALDSLVLK